MNDKLSSKHKKKTAPVEMKTRSYRDSKPRKNFDFVYTKGTSSASNNVTNIVFFNTITCSVFLYH
jgi:hypothetical protein